MTAERDPIDGLLDSVSDGAVVDWDSVVHLAGPEDRRTVEALRDVDRITRFNRGLQRGAAVGASGPDATGDVPRWGDLLLLELCGAGAQADVYRAWDPRLRREVALKLLRPGAPGADGPADQSPLWAEGRALARIRHPHVVAVHGIDRCDGRVGLWMELVRGETLEQQVEAQGPLSAAEAVRLGREIGSALAAVHAAGLLHRDIKPANVVVDAAGRFVLTDFGLGLARREGVPPPAGLAGSPMYMAPEQLDGAAPGPRTDVHALGLLLWFALAGRHPYPDSSLAELRAAMMHGPRPALRALRSDLPAGLVDLVGRATASDSALRTGSAAGVVAGLEQLGARPARPRLRRRGAVAAALAVMLVAVVFGALRGRGHRVPPSGAATPYAVEAAFLRHGAGAPEMLANDDAVAPGDRLSLRWRATREVWVYVLNTDEHGEAFLLFPQPWFSRRNPLPADSTLTLPGAMNGGDVAWTVTSAGGRETFLVVASPEPVPELEAGPAGFSAPAKDRPVEYRAVGAGAVERLRGVGGLQPVPSAAADGPASGTAALGRFRALAGRESGVTGIWVREIVLRNPG